jgi:hypothetical protein
MDGKRGGIQAVVERAQEQLLPAFGRQQYSTQEPDQRAAHGSVTPRHTICTNNPRYEGSVVIIISQVILHRTGKHKYMKTSGEKPEQCLLPVVALNLFDRPLHHRDGWG